MSNPLDRSINDVNRLAKALFILPGFLLAGCLLASPSVASADWPALRFSADQLEFGDLRFEAVQAALTESGSVQAAFGSMEGPGQTLMGDGLTLEGTLEELDVGDGDVRLRGRLAAWGLAADVSVVSQAGGLEVKLAAKQQSVAPLAGLRGLPPELEWLTGGEFDAGLTWRKAADGPAGLTFDLAVENLAFDSPEGRFAGDALHLAARGSAPGGDLSRLDLDGVIDGGELLLDDFYRNFGDGGLTFEAALRLAETALEIPALHLRDDAALNLEASAVLGLGAEANEWSLQVSHLELQFPAAYRRYLEPLAAAWTLDGLELTGSLRWNGRLSPGEFISGDLDVSDLTVVDTRRGRFALTGLETQLRPGDHTFDSRLTWRGLIFGRINLGAGQAALDHEPGGLALLEPLALDVLGGRLELQRLKFVFPNTASGAPGEPDIRLQARLDQVDMKLLTAALGWPSFTGRISGEIPGVKFDDGILDVDGEIRVQVFDGRITLRNLRVERPFGVLPSLAGDVEIESLDLDQLTQTFSFGHISGRLDGYVRDLRMLDWKPVAFDAWLGTPGQQEGSNDISRQAVNHLTTIGGGPVTTALTSPLMRAFSNFSYRRLGLGCRLVDYVCELRGLSGDPDSVLILEGSGVPKITIRAFNRKIDWPQMVANLLAVSAGDTIQVGNGPGP